MSTTANCSATYPIGAPDSFETSFYMQTKIKSFFKAEYFNVNHDFTVIAARCGSHHTAEPSEEHTAEPSDKTPEPEPTREPEQMLEPQQKGGRRQLEADTWVDLQQRGTSEAQNEAGDIVCFHFEGTDAQRATELMERTLSADNRRHALETEIGAQDLTCTFHVVEPVKREKGAPIGAIVGGVLGGLVICAAIAALVLYARNRTNTTTGRVTSRRFPQSDTNLVDVPIVEDGRVAQEMTENAEAKPGATLVGMFAAAPPPEDVVFTPYVQRNQYDDVERLRMI